MRPYLLLQAIALFAFPVSHAQNTSLYFNHLNVNNGLSQGVAAVTLKDSRGFIWITTLDGIDRFDGISCKHYDLSGLAAVNLSQTTTNFLEDKNGDIWAGTQHGLLKYTYRQDAFSYYPLDSIGIDNNYSSPDIIQISYIDERNRLWLQRQNFFYCFDIDKLTSQEFEVPPIYQLPIVLFPHQKPFLAVDHFYAIDVWSGIIYRATCRNDRLIWESKAINSPVNIKGASFLAHDTIVLYSENELYRYHFDKGEIVLIKRLPITGYITSLASRSGLLWVGTNNDGLLSINILTKKIINWCRYSAYNNNSLPLNDVSDLFIDDYANLWVSIWGEGISFTNLEKFRMQKAFTKDEAQKHGCTNFIRCIAPDSKGDIWSTTSKEYLICFTAGLQFRKKVDLPFAVSHFLIDKYDHIWFANDNNAFRYSIRNKKLTKLEKTGNAKTKSINHVMQLKNGRILFSCDLGVWFTGKGLDFQPLESLPQRQLVNMIFENKKGYLFVGIDRVGMYIYEPVGDDGYKLRNTFALPGNPKCFYEQNDSTLWIATTTGLILFDQRKEKIKKVFTTNDGFANNYMYTCLPDSRQNLWVTSNKGITVFNMQTRHCRNFNIQDGIQSNEFNSFAYAATSDGSLIFGGINGLNRIKPSSLTDYVNLARPQITYIKADSVINPFSFESDTRLVLPYDKSGIEIGIVGLEYANASANTLKYILEGKDREWSFSPNKGLIQYAHLSPGTYRFKLMAANCDGFWSEEIKTLNIVVLSPFWLTWWFLGASFVFILTGLYLIYRFRLRQLLAMERLRTRIATDLHDEIGSTLSSISMYSETVKNQVKGKLPQLENILEKIGENSRTTVSSMSDIVWAINPDNDDAEKLLTRMENYAIDNCSVANISLHLHIDEKLKHIHFTVEQRKNIYLIFKESLNNALKYSGAANIWISLVKRSGSFCMRIKDDGKGFDPDEVGKGNGLKNLRIRAGELKGSLQIDTGKGTEVNLICQI